MKFTVFTIVSVLSIVVAYAQDLQSAIVKNGRIANGKDAELGQFPHQAFLSVRNFFGNGMCGGSLIHINWILTAAHCTDNARNITVLLGTILLEINSAEQVFKVNRSSIFNHPGYNRLTLANDIALIYIPAANITDLVKPILLPQNATDTYENNAANATGWGRLGDFRPVSIELQWGQMKIVKNEVCFQSYGLIITDNMLCVATTDKVSTCTGDSGGPLVVDSNNVLIGVTSFGHRSGCEKRRPTGFTRVNKYLNWIEDTQNSFNSSRT